MAGATPRSAHWSERIFDALPLAPIWVGAGLALVERLLAAAFG